VLPSGTRCAGAWRFSRLERRHAAVVRALARALYTPVWTSAINNAMDFRARHRRVSLARLLARAALAGCRAGRGSARAASPLQLDPRITEFRRCTGKKSGAACVKPLDRGARKPADPASP